MTSAEPTSGPTTRPHETTDPRPDVARAPELPGLASPAYETAIVQGYHGEPPAPPKRTKA